MTKIGFNNYKPIELEQLPTPRIKSHQDLHLKFVGDFEHDDSWENIPFRVTNQKAIKRILLFKSGIK